MNPTRESRYVKVVRMAYGLTQQTLPRYAHPKSPHHFTFPQLAACVLVMFYLKMTYRDMEELLLASDAICRVLELPRVPDHTTLSRTFKKLRRLNLDELNRRLLDAMGWRKSSLHRTPLAFPPRKPAPTTRPAADVPFGAPGRCWPIPGSMAAGWRKAA